jgi:shikimate kinase
MKVFLIGFMGSGKSTIGKLLSTCIHYRFFDSDMLVEMYLNKDIPSIFHLMGEEAFRQAENKVLLKVIKKPGNAIISTGGGTACFFDHMQLMNSSGITIYLKRSADDLYELLKYADQDRPLLKEIIDLKTTIKHMLEQREVFYNKAKHIINIDSKDTVDNVVKRIMEIISIRLKVH